MRPTDPTPTPDGTPPAKPDVVLKALDAFLEADARFEQVVTRTDDLPPFHCGTRDVWMPQITDMLAELDVADAALGKLIAALEAEEGAAIADGRERRSVETAALAPAESELDADAVRRKIETGLWQCETGQTLPHDEAMKRLGKWLNRNRPTEVPKA